MCYETEKDCNAENRPFPDILKTGQIGGGNVALYSCSPCLGTGRFFDTSLIKRNIGLIANVCKKMIRTTKRPKKRVPSLSFYCSLLLYVL